MIKNEAPKTIILVSPHTDQYGAERSMIANINSIMRHGVNVLLIIPCHGRIEEWLNRDNIPYIVEKFYDVINHEDRVRLHYGLGKNAVNFFKVMKISRLLQKMKITPILVHSNSITTDFGILLSRHLQVPHVQHIRELGEYDFGMTFDMGIRHFAKVCGQSQRIICISDAVYQYYSNYLPKEKLVRIYNGIAEPKIPRRITGREEAEPVQLVMVGRLSGEKGQLQAIHAVKAIKDKIKVHLDLWGDGVDKELLQKEIEANQLTNEVSLCGFSNHIQYEKYHIALICSKYEAFGRVTVEYMFEGLPVIGTNSGATKEIILDHETGLLYQDGNVEQLSDCIMQLSEDEALRMKLAQQGQHRAKTEFSEEVYCEKLYEQYRQICTELH